MEAPTHSINVLFEQLGIDSSQSSIDNFIASHSPLPNEIALHKAGFWSSSQADFLKQAKDDDSDWAEVADQLDIMLR